MAQRIKGTKVDVTAEDIREGVRLGCYDCPVALAISRATGEQAHVFGSTVQLSGESRRTWRLPDDALDRIRAYDDGESMVPFTFEILGQVGR